MYCKHLNQLRFRPVFDIKSNNKAIEPLTDEDQDEPHDNDPPLTLPVSIPSKKPLDTRRKLNVHKTLKRRPGCLLDILCTFNLRALFTGNIRTKILSFNPFVASIPILYPLKTPENQRFFSVFRGYNKMGTLVTNGLTTKTTLTEMPNAITQFYKLVSNYFVKDC